MILAFALNACSASHTIAGTMILSDDKVDWSSTSCSGTGGYSDIGEGTGVTVKDGDGKVIGSSHLVDDPKGSSAGRCAYTFTVQVPDSPFYVIEVSHRGELTYSNDEMAGRDWAVGMTLGD